MRLGAFFFEIMPLAGFFVGFHYYGLFIAALISVGLAGVVFGADMVACRLCRPVPVVLAGAVSRIYRGGRVVRCGYFHQDSTNHFQWFICGCIAWWFADETRHDAGVFCQTIFSNR